MRRLLPLSLCLALGCSRTQPEVDVAPPRPVVAPPSVGADRVSEDVQALQDRTNPRRAQVLTAWQTQPPSDPRVLPVVLSLAQDAGEPLRGPALTTLGRLPLAPESVDLLLVVANDEGSALQPVAVEALGQLDPGSAKVQVTLKRALQARALPVRLATVAALRKQGPAATVALASALDSPEPELRLAVLAALADLGPAAKLAIPAVRRATAPEQPEAVRQAAQATLGRLEPPPSDVD